MIKASSGECGFEVSHPFARKKAKGWGTQLHPNEEGLWLRTPAQPIGRVCRRSSRKPGAHGKNRPNRRD